MREAVTDLREGSRPPEQLARLQDELERLRGDTARLRERVEALEGADQKRTPGVPPASSRKGEAAPRPPKRQRPAARRGGRSRPNAPIRRR